MYDISQILDRKITLYNGYCLVLKVGRINIYLLAREK